MSFIAKFAPKPKSLEELLVIGEYLGVSVDLGGQVKSDTGRECWGLYDHRTKQVHVGDRSIHNAQAEVVLLHELAHAYGYGERSGVSRLAEEYYACSVAARVGAMYGFDVASQRDHANWYSDQMFISLGFREARRLVRDMDAWVEEAVNLFYEILGAEA